MLHVDWESVLQVSVFWSGLTRYDTIRGTRGGSGLWSELNVGFWPMSHP